MAQISHLKSAAITNSDATPPVANNTGAGAAGYLKEVTGSVVVVAADSIASTYRLARVPTNAKVKSVILTSQAQGQGNVDVGVFYPTIGLTGKADLVANAIVAAFFASSVDLTSAVQPTDVTNESGTYTADLWSQPLWQAVGLSSDPGGYFDIVASVVTNAVTTGTGILGLSIRFVE